MFGKLRDKLKNWARGLTKKAEEIPEEKEISKKEIIHPIQEQTKTISKILEKDEKKKSKKILEEAGIQQREIKKPEIEKKETIAEIIEKKNAEDEKLSDEELKPGKMGFFRKILSKITKVKISEKEFDIYAEELEMLLIENNVALEVAEKVIKELKRKIVGKEILKKEIEYEIKDIFKEILRGILMEPFNLVREIKNRQDKSKPYVILFCGINGTGKTTTIAKIASQLKENNLSCVLAAGDTFRAASIEQIKKHGEKVGVEVIAHAYESDPASVGFDAIKYAEKKHIDCVLIDTAGRMHTSKNLMVQIEKISKVCKPNAKIFVGESITGNDIIEQVKTFDLAVGIDGIILTKADIDEKGGTALSVGYVTKKPILYLGTGQEYDKIKVFNKEEFIKELGLDWD